jgi:hypothetical protein
VKDIDKYKGILTYGGKKDGADSAVGTTDLTGKVSRRGCGGAAGRLLRVLSCSCWHQYRRCRRRVSHHHCCWQLPAR